jgi:hypothetical protein
LWKLPYTWSKETMKENESRKDGIELLWRTHLHRTVHGHTRPWELDLPCAQKPVTPCRSATYTEISMNRSDSNQSHKRSHLLASMAVVLHLLRLRPQN